MVMYLGISPKDIGSSPIDSTILIIVRVSYHEKGGNENGKKMFSSM